MSPITGIFNATRSRKWANFGERFLLMTMAAMLPHWPAGPHTASPTDSGGDGYELVSEPEGFVIDRAEGPPPAGEHERAREWGAAIARRATAYTTEPTP